MYPSVYWGDLLRSLRKKNHLMQKEVALILRISRQSYSQLETGRVQPSPEQLAVLSNIYNINLLNYVMKCFPAEYVEEQSNYRAILQENIDNENARELIARSLPKETSLFTDDPGAIQLSDALSEVPSGNAKARKKVKRLREPLFPEDMI